MEVLAAAEAAAAVQRLDTALQQLFPGRWPTVSALKKAVRRGEVLVNGAASTTDATVKQGDRVEVVTAVGCAKSAAAQLTSHTHLLNKQQQLPGLEVAYEDDHIAVVVKPQGLVSQGPKGPASVAGRVKYCLQPTSVAGALNTPVIAHRLDVGTGGLMMIAKTRAAVVQLSRDLIQHSIQKRYLALVTGRLEGAGVVDYEISGVPSVSLFRAEAHLPSVTFGCLTLVSLWPKTGRTHQLRKHMAYLGHPVLGDLKYKHHRKPDCQAVLADIHSWLPQFAAADSSTQQQQQHPPPPCKQQQHACQEELPIYDGSSSSTYQQSSSSSKQRAQEAEAEGDDDGGSSSSSGSELAGRVKLKAEVLRDGTLVGTCLWAVELQLSHPFTGEPVRVSVASAVERLLRRIGGLDAPPDDGGGDVGGVAS